MSKTTTIQIRDEVNCKLTNLDLHTRKKLSNMLKFQVPYARHLPSVKLGRWDGKVGFFQLGGGTYINLLDEILPVVIDAGYEIEIDDQRVPTPDFEFEKVTEDSFAHINWPTGHELAGQPIKLRDHQIDVINNFLANPQSLQEVATGAGKTIVTAALSSRAEPYGRTIVIVPNKSLVTQTEEDYIKAIFKIT